MRDGRSEALLAAWNVKSSKRYLLQVAARNLGLIMRKLFGMGTPRGLQKDSDLAAPVYLCCWALSPHPGIAYDFATSTRISARIATAAAAVAPPAWKRRISTGCYTRKSTDEGLEKEFNSLDAQRESAEAYIKSQAHAGWMALPERYDDGGFSGGNMERPALKKLLADIEAGQVDCVVLYKIDRLSRSLLDFARIIETFDRHKVSFVSVTQQFNTASSMGRLILNVLLSFAQFEREIISERTRDKMAAARRRGKWTGGPVPFGL